MISSRAVEPKRLRYGMYSTMAGTGRSSFGRQMRAESSTPSGIGIRTSACSVISNGKSVTVLNLLSSRLDECELKLLFHVTEPVKQIFLSVRAQKHYGDFVTVAVLELKLAELRTLVDEQLHAHIGIFLPHR